jgi:SAM-dependent methyltransferase
MATESTFRDRRPSARYEHPPEQVTELKEYLLHREATLDRGARSVLAIDLSPGLSAEPFELAMEEAGVEFGDYEFRREDVHDTALTGDSFDLIVSNGVFEHVMDIKGVLNSFRTLLNPGGRIAIFADGLWYSSIGGHAGLGPWEHLTRTPAELKESLSAQRWKVYREQLNRMTAADFLDAVRTAGLMILRLNLNQDPNIEKLPGLLPAIREQHVATPADLSVVSIGCELCFPENL